jgi:uncharacterized protein (TIGR02594 family)
MNTNESPSEPPTPSDINYKTNDQLDSLEHLELHYQTEYPQEIKWYKNKFVEMLYSTAIFAISSYLIITLLTLFSEKFGVFINSRMIFTANISDNILLHSAKRLRTESELLPATERMRALKLAQNLENAANELEGTEQFILKSKIKSAPVWLQTAVAEYTRQNKLGVYNNRILQYVSSIGNYSIQTLHTTNLAWSSHFVNWIMQKSNLTGTNNAQASSWLHWGKPLTELKRGAIAIFKLDKSDIVGFVLLETKNYDIVLAGDVLSAIGILAFKKTNLLGYRWP